MYEQFFGLRERPFDLTSSPRSLVMIESHREVLLNLESGLGTQQGITLLVGQAGSGKSTLIRAAIERRPARVHCFHVQNPALTRSEFFEMLAAYFGLSDAASRSKTTMLVELQRMFFERRHRRETTALVVDEAQSLPLELLADLRWLADIETSPGTLMRVIIAGQPKVAERLNSAGLRQLKQRISVRCELRPLGARETAAYVAGRIRAAGGAGAQVFTREAVALIGAHSRGLPKLINVIADNALLGGFAVGKRPVGAEIVREICGDVDIQAAPATTPVPLSSFSSPGDDVGTAAEAMAPPQDVAVLAAEPFTAQAVQEPAASDMPKVDVLPHADDREVQEIFFNTYFEKVWSGQR